MAVVMMTMIVMVLVMVTVAMVMIVVVIVIMMVVLCAHCKIYVMTYPVVCSNQSFSVQHKLS
jgi:hypothetical protein